MRILHFGGNRRRNINLRLVLHFIGLTLLFESVFMLFALVMSFAYDKESMLPVAKSMFITFVAGGILYYLTRSKLETESTARESFMIVFFSWLSISLFGTLPFLLSHSINNFTDALFESVSGFTTTGSSILTDIESVNRGILFWRSETHWIGGMGIIVLVLTIFPFYKVNAMQLFGAESSIVVFEKLKPRMIDNVKRIWLVYISLTLVETILLKWGGMDLLDSMAHAFGTIATGGFSTKNSSIAGFSPYIQYVIMIFMALSGINFALHYLGFKGRFKRIVRNEEFRLYISLLFIAGVLSTGFLVLHKHYHLEYAFRKAFFQVISIMTCTGYTTADYQLWGPALIFMIFLLMLIGGSSGSTSGGIKVVRILILLKHFRAYFGKIMHPSQVKPLKYNRSMVTTRQQNSIFNYILIYCMVVLIGTLIMSLTGLDLRTALGSVTTTLGGIGPGFGMVGPVGTFADISGFGKIFLSLIMLLGRLEILTVFVIFTPSFWKA